ncbi:heavy-metal-associated domain-containing protein [Anabaena cylindrica FACHB-243]|uniref:Heavy metal transport/detoxification protein n=1 Tax=Anabaena cylindrica (strain ATCC 27899 / PCC 7122) TaxID=272123 RepID=K9ZR35_ANACC|nr:MULTISPECIES: heavy-metal-associated domain-containing protein [Anabaena]AFZ61219.1 Heavy metal transport/detoxification protein [Anabaena cylindrica PCC 7122]MBD2421695.1 heavy-metal-associated domain-containing protein [Anabaena cylindrica FACHB-243]MBY5280548.1 heavy-metal-associated domain-containing protein [Anabaena sp. CCAP 1446/1C]MBY5308137.1 heavy-metal-associated domain-containing protein [Anabaena sp. CCAP 1446/1C]MCM2405402.1 heavy-metal-associated domain-containing protein [An
MTIQLTIPKLACSSCADAVTTAIKKVDAAATVKADTKTKTVSVETQASETVVKEAIASAGYPSI